jgi:hypothetical protein
MTPLWPPRLTVLRLGSGYSSMFGVSDQSKPASSIAGVTCLNDAPYDSAYSKSGRVTLMAGCVVAT